MPSPPVAVDYKIETKAPVVNADARTLQTELQNTRQEAAKEIDKLRAELKNSQQGLDAAKRLVAELRDDMSKIKIQSQRQNALSVMVGKCQEDLASLRATLGKERETNNMLAKQNAELKDEVAAAQIERRTLQEQNNRMEKQLQQMAKDMARMRVNGGAATMARAGGKDPPPEKDEGLVRYVDSKAGDVDILMIVTIGANAGLANGDILELFRVNLAEPQQSKYLGRVRILEADRHDSVAQSVGRLSAPPQRGDRVARRILHGPS